MELSPAMQLANRKYANSCMLEKQSFLQTSKWETLSKDCSYQRLSLPTDLLVAALSRYICRLAPVSSDYFFLL